MARDTVVIDLDGTLSDCSYRRYLVEGKHRDYGLFHDRLGEDPVNQWCADLMRAMTDAWWLVAIVSARPALCRTATVKWLKQHRVAYNSLHLLRRDHKDKTPDNELKMAWLQKYGAKRILFVVDDRQKVVDAWRAAGVTCLQCAAWEESK